MLFIGIIQVIVYFWFYDVSESGIRLSKKADTDVL
jgi:hypothetical protein